MAGGRQTGGTPQIKAIMTDAAIKAQHRQGLGGHGSRRWTRRARPSWITRRSPSWRAKIWARAPGIGQMIAVSYERARGIRAMNQKCDGEFSVSVTRVMERPAVEPLCTPRRRSPRPGFPKALSRKPPAPRTNIGAGKWKSGPAGQSAFYAKGAGKAQIALAVQQAGRRRRGGKRTRALEESDRQAPGRLRQNR